MNLKTLAALVTVLIIISFQFADAATVVKFDASRDLSGTVFGFEFLVEPSSPGSSWTFEPTFVSEGGALPDSWLDVSTATRVVYFELFTPGSALQTGQIGAFDVDTTLNNFVLSDADGNPDTFVLDENFFVTFDQKNNTYLITGTPVPIPSTLLLIGGGLVGVIGLKRKLS